MQIILKSQNRPHPLNKLFLDDLPCSSHERPNGKQRPGLVENQIIPLICSPGGLAVKEDELSVMGLDQTSGDLGPRPISPPDLLYVPGKATVTQCLSFPGLYNGDSK